MKRADLINALAIASDADKTTVSRLLDAFPKIVADALRADGAIIIPGIAKIEARAKPARTMRNPATGAQIEKPESMAVSLKALKPLKDVVASFPMTKIAAE